MRQSTAIADDGINDDGTRIIMKRLIITILVLLLFGAIVNVAVAWTVSYSKNLDFKDHRTIRPSEADLIDRRWLQHVESDSASAKALSEGSIIVTDSNSLTFREYSKIPYGVTRIGRDMPLSFQVRAGWPLHSLYGGGYLTARGRGWISPATGVKWLYATPLDGTVRSVSVNYVRVLPLRPLWLGFAVNTLFYATIVLIAFAVVNYLRRWFRRRRGQSPTCGYPMGESPRCTECGTDLPVADFNA